METAVQKDDLQALGQLLQELLNSELATKTAIQVKCTFQNDILLILAQEANPLVDQAQPIFRVLQETIEGLQLSFPSSVWEQTQQVRLFLRATGQRQPFAVHEFKLEKSADSDESSLSDSEAAFIRGNSDENAFKWQEESDDIWESVLQDESNLDEATEDAGKEAVAESTLNSNLMADLPLEEPTTDLEPDPDPIIQEHIPGAKVDRKKPPFKVPQSVWKIGAGMVIVGALGGIYALSRPCAVGECPAIQTAKQLSQSSAQTLRNAKNDRDVNQGKEKLTQAIEQLESIPFWSKHHSSAQRQLPIYKGAVAKVDSLLNAVDKAKVAAQKSQNPPHPVQEWQEIQTLWNQAIASLKQVPKNSPVYPITQEKLKTYQANLAAINNRVKQEQQAETRLASGKETARLAQMRQSVAKTLNHWQQVESTWQAAINSLSSIPKTTMAYEEAQQLISSYQPNFATVRDRKNQEEISDKIYNQAISIATLAKNLEQQNQLTKAVATWRRASTYAKQVVPGTYYYDLSQPLSDNYTNSLRQAQTKLQTTLIVQKASTDLNRICAGVPKICDATVNLQVIKAYLTPAYVASVRRTAMTAGLQGDANTIAGVDDHLKTLQAALEAISENAGITLEIYDHNRSLIGRYIPKQIANR